MKRNANKGEMDENIKHFVLGVCIAFVMLGAFASVALASATTYYVPDDHEKIQWAVDNATDGDTIIVKDGVFHENIEVDKRLTLRSENGSENCIVQAADPYDDVFHITADHVNISGFTIKEGDYGIYLDNVENCNIANNNISNNGDDGISLRDSSNNVITGNNISNNRYDDGIRLEDSSNNVITGNSISDNWDGIELEDSSNNLITGNIILNNRHEGVDMWASSSNNITGNTMTNDGVLIDGYELRHWNTHTIENNTVNGKPLYYFKDISGGKVPEDAGQVILANCTGMLIENLIINNTGIGIEIGFSSQNIIKNNNVSNNLWGIGLGYSSDNNITGNIILNNENDGIDLCYSSNNTITGNNIPNNEEDGIYLGDSSSNNITGNSISNNDWEGIYLDYSDDNIISDNNISNNGDDGIYLEYSSDNSIMGNIILNNRGDGIYLWHSSDNLIYLNNIINNTDNVYSCASTNIWNSTHKITYSYNGSTYTNYLGNYWDDYTGSDADEDGIGDTPYSIGGDKDNYPLMERFEHYFVPTPVQTFDTGRPENPYPSISGKFIGTIRTNTKIIATKLYTYACEGTGGHTEYALICNSTWCAEAEWEGYKGDWMNISFNKTVILMPYETYNITIVTGSYPQIHHTHSLKTENGWINCTEFTDANGNKYEDRLPAIMLWS